MHIYSKFFGEYSHTVGQVLLTRDVIEDEHIKQNVCNTFELLLQKGIIPIVNENDTVSIDELENIAWFGDNDNLSAIVSVLIDADLLIILSDIDGFYDSNPKEKPNAKLIKQIDEITEEINKKYIKLRYKFIPYLYDMMHKCEKSGAPIIRPLLYNYQNDKW